MARGVNIPGIRSWTKVKPGRGYREVWVHPVGDGEFVIQPEPQKASSGPIESYDLLFRAHERPQRITRCAMKGDCVKAAKRWCRENPQGVYATVDVEGPTRGGGRSRYARVTVRGPTRKNPSAKSYQVRMRALAGALKGGHRDTISARFPTRRDAEAHAEKVANFYEVTGVPVEYEIVPSTRAPHPSPRRNPLNVIEADEIRGKMHSANKQSIAAHRRGLHNLSDMAEGQADAYADVVNNYGPKPRTKTRRNPSSVDRAAQNAREFAKAAKDFKSRMQELGLPTTRTRRARESLQTLSLHIADLKRLARGERAQVSLGWAERDGRTQIRYLDRVIGQWEVDAAGGHLRGNPLTEMESEGLMRRANEHDRSGNTVDGPASHYEYGMASGLREAAYRNTDARSWMRASNRQRSVPRRSRPNPARKRLASKKKVAKRAKRVAKKMVKKTAKKTVRKKTAKHSARRTAAPSAVSGALSKWKATAVGKTGKKRYTTRYQGVTFCIDPRWKTGARKLDANFLGYVVCEKAGGDIRDWKRFANPIRAAQAVSKAVGKSAPAPKKQAAPKKAKRKVTKKAKRPAGARKYKTKKKAAKKPKRTVTKKAKRTRKNPALVIYNPGEDPIAEAAAALTPKKRTAFRRIVSRCTPREKAELRQALERYYEFHGAWPDSITSAKGKVATKGTRTRFLVGLGKADHIGYHTNKGYRGSDKDGDPFRHYFEHGQELVTDPTGTGLAVVGAGTEVSDWIHG